MSVFREFDVRALLARAIRSMKRIIVYYKGRSVSGFKNIIVIVVTTTICMVRYYIGSIRCDFYYRRKIYRLPSCGCIIHRSEGYCREPFTCYGPQTARKCTGLGTAFIEAHPCHITINIGMKFQPHLRIIIIIGISSRIRWRACSI